MTVSGMRPDEVRALAGRLRSAAVRLRAIQSGVDGRVARSSWVGPQATRFRTEVWPRHRAALMVTAQGLERLAADAERQAADQERTSASSAAGVSAHGQAGGTYRGLGGSGEATAESSPGWWPAPKDLVTLAGVAPVLANAVSWRRHLNQVFYSPWTQRVPGLSVPVGFMAQRLAGVHVPQSVRDLAQRAKEIPVPAGVTAVAHRVAAEQLPQRATHAVTTFLNGDRLKPVMNVLDNKYVSVAGKALGAWSVVDEGVEAAEAFRAGDNVAGALHVVDAGASALKMSKFPPAYLAGVGIDLATDVVEIATGPMKWKDIRPWDLW